MSTLSLLPLLLGADNRLIHFDFPLIGGQAGLSSLWLVILGAIVLSIAVGILFAQAVRMKDYGWKVALILASLTSSLLLVLFGQYKLGVDLQGGVILVYEVDEKETEALAQGSGETWDINRLIHVISNRLNSSGLKEIVVRPFGPKQIEVIVPEVDQAEVDKVKQQIVQGGNLQFLIVASEIRDSNLFEAARAQAAQPNEALRTERIVKDEAGARLGAWVKVARVKASDPASAPFRDASVVQGLIRDSRTGQVIDLTPQQQTAFSNTDSQAGLQDYLATRGIKQIDALMVINPDQELNGEDLAYARVGNDQQFRPCINFGMRGDGVFEMGTLTANNIDRKLAIIFDNELLSAPVIRSRISDNGEITGSFTVEEVQFIVDILKSGSLPVVLYKNPISENTIGSILGRDTIEKGSYSIVVALCLVLVFILLYYRFSGLVACFALLLNILLTVGIMILVQAPFTLPGLAGLVLTVGMSVDSNVLIFERIREELARGAALRMAIRNGFEKALVTIIDSNLTTLLTAVVLYAIGTDQVRGFGATLILGIVTSMFTAIFCSRVVFDIGERTRWLREIKMTNLMGTRTIDWCKYLVPAIVASSIVIGIGLVGTVARGKGLFDIDLAGGTSVTFILKEPMTDADVRKKVEAVLASEKHPETKAAISWSLNEVKVSGEEKETVYKVDSSIPEVTDLQAKLREAFLKADGTEGLKTFNLKVGELTETKVTASVPQIGPAPVDPAKAAPPAEPAKPETAKPGEPEGTKPETKPEEAKPAEAKPEQAKPDAKQPEENNPENPCGDEPEKLAEEKKPEEKLAETKPAEPKSDEAPKPAEKPAETKPAAETPQAAASEPGNESPLPVKPTAPREQYTTKVALDFPASAISAQALRDRLTAAAQKTQTDATGAYLENPNWDRQDNSAFEQWTVTLPLSKADAQMLLGQMQADLESDVVWQTSSKIGGQVSKDTRLRAVWAILVSLLGILAYVWFRFQRAVWGIAAIVALAHDALIMLGGLAVSYWLVGAPTFLQLEEFKISLPVVAAFLTLIGYSVNDTIVIFDRIREIRGKSPDITAKMINDSVNQTLSRTILTGGTTLMVVVILYFFGGPGIHAFAFSLVIGVISGSYSTVFIAAPILLWLMGKKNTSETPAASREMAKSA